MRPSPDEGAGGRGGAEGDVAVSSEPELRYRDEARRWYARQADELAAYELEFSDEPEFVRPLVDRR